MTNPSPEFLNGEAAVFTDAATMALVIAVDWNGACDIQAHIPKSEVVRILRHVANQYEEPHP